MPEHNRNRPRSGRVFGSRRSATFDNQVTLRSKRRGNLIEDEDDDEYEDDSASLFG